MHPRGLNPGGTGTGRQTTRPAGGLFPALAARPAAVVPGGGVCFPCRFPPAAFSFDSAPHPPARARRALFPAALARPAPGERTISNAEVPLPRSPLSLAAGTAQGKDFLSVLRRTAGSLARGARIAEAVSAANGLMQGCRGRSPRRNKLLVTPFPGGEGGGGIGARKKTKGKVSRRQSGQATPTDSGTARSAGDQPGKPHNGHLHRRFSPCRLRLRREDARGEAPCIRKPKISPFPGGEGGWGDRGKKENKRQGQPATKQASHPNGFRNGKVSRRPAG